VGAFYGSVHLRTEDRQIVRQIVEALAKQHGRFLIGPALGGWVGVYPENHGQDECVAEAIASRFPGTVLYVMVHDSDIFAYSFFRDGRLIDSYNSCPDYFGESDESEECGGRPEVFRDLLPDEAAVQQLAELLAADNPVFAEDSLQHFADILGLPNALTSYEYLGEGETGGIEGRGDFLHVPDQSAEKARKQAAEADVAAAKQRLIAERVLLLERSATGLGLVPAWCPDRAGNGFLSAWPNPADRSPCPVVVDSPPWTGPQPSGIVTDAIPAQPQGLELSPSGRYLAVGDNAGKARLWDLDRRKTVLEVTQQPGVVAVAFSPDEKHLVILSRDKGCVLAVDGGRRVAAFAVPAAKLVAVHPDGTLVVADELGKLAFLDLLSGQTRKTLWAGGRQNLGRVFQRLPGDVALRSVDPAELQAKLQAAVQQQLAQAEALQEKVRAAYRKAGLPEPPDLQERMRQELQKIADLARQQLQPLAAAATPEGLVPAAAFGLVGGGQGMDRVMSLAISADGRWLFYTCEAGVRALAWDDLQSATESTPEPVFSAASEPVVVNRGGSTQRHTYTVAHDAAASCLLFAGLEGTVRFLDLTSGAVGVLLDPPGRPAILRLSLSRDRTALCCTCMPDLFASARQRQAPLLQVWDYAAITGNRG
jgi:WD40 repeat protein